MTGADDLRFDTDLLDVLSQHVTVGDGAMGNGVLNETRPDAVEAKYVRLQSG